MYIPAAPPLLVQRDANHHTDQYERQKHYGISVCFKQFSLRISFRN